MTFLSSIKLFKDALLLGRNFRFVLWLLRDELSTILLYSGTASTGAGAPPPPLSGPPDHTQTDHTR
jgi:hypothetical protein